MSRAFVKEQDEGVPGGDLPERNVSEHPNLVTADGLRKLTEALGRLEERRLELRALGDDAVAQDELAHVDRDLRYYASRLESAEVVDVASQPPDMVAFGALVHVAGERGERRSFRIVGEDEADLASGRISYLSPLAVALLGHRPGDRVVWKRPAGDLELTIESLDYSVEDQDD